MNEVEAIAVGVRALVHGAWGFIADTELTADMMDWMGRAAAGLGKESAWRECPPVELGDRPPVATGSWQMPVKRDPFTVPDAEYHDLIKTILGKIQDLKGAADMTFCFGRQERTFASTDGSFTTQTVYNSFNRMNGPSYFLIQAKNENTYAKYMVPIVNPHGMGYEVFEHEKMLDRLPEWMDKADEALDAEKFDTPGRFEVVFDGHTMAALVSCAGVAMEMDRAIGYEADAAGTSYLAPIDKMLGTKQFPAEVTITANRTLVGGAATVQWDDEGVRPQDFTLVENGKLIDYTTSREFVPEMAGWYKAQGLPAHSRGCAGAENALSVPLVQTPNLQLQPGKKDMSFEDLLAGIDDGLAVMGGDFYPDQQQLNAIGGRDALIYRVKKGKLAGPVDDARYIVRMPDLWKDLVALGGEKSVQTRGFTIQKGQPGQSTVHSVQAPAARFQHVAVRGLS
jgi:TldD protein